MTAGAVTTYANLPSTQVSLGGTDAPIGGTIETWTVLSSASFPAASAATSPPTWFHVGDAMLPGEVITVLTASGDTWTVVRGAEGTTPVAHAPGWTVVQVTSAGDYAALAVRADLNVVTVFKADPTATLDSTSAINTALSVAAPGQRVYLPTGIYKTTAPIVIPPGGVLIGDYAPEVGTYLDFLAGSVIQPAATWSNGSAAWNGIISLIGQPDGSYSVTSEEQKVTGIMLDCHLLTTGSADGIQLYGGVSRAHFERVCIAQAPGNSFNTVFDGSGVGPGSYRLNRVTARYAGGSGFVLYRTSDISAFDCLAENNAVDGFTITNLSNGMLIGCRAEHNGTPGSSGNNPASGNGFTYVCTSSGTGSGVAKFVSCSTDRNQAYGFAISSSDNSGVPVQITGCQIRRDGQNATANTPAGAGGNSFAGLYVTAYPGTVIVSGTSIFPGVNDSGTGQNSPQNGMLIASNSASGNVLVGASYIQGATTAISDDQSSSAVLYDLATLAATGGTGSPTVFGPRTGTGTLSGGTATVACTSVRSSSVILITMTSQGAHSGVVAYSKNNGVGFVVTSSNALDANTFSWVCTTP